MSLDLTKPIQARGGAPARVLATNLKHDNGQSVVVAIDYGNWEEVYTILPNGSYHTNGCSPKDIVNVPVKHTMWLNINQYRDSLDSRPIAGALYASKDAANAGRLSGRMACIKIEFTEGDGL